MVQIITKKYKYQKEKVSTEQDEQIKKIAEKDDIGYLDAKEIFFSSLTAFKKDLAAPLPGRTRTSLLVSQAKLGVTLVISKEDCAKLKIDPNKTTTKEAVKILKTKLGL